MGVIGIVLAAGAGTRLGGAVPKPLVAFRGRPLLSWPLAALAEGGVRERIVVLGAEAEAVAAGVELGDASVVVCEEWAEGLSASLRAGVAAAHARGAEAVVIVLADQPLLTGAAVARVVAARAPGELDAIRASYRGVPGHPTLLESSLFVAIGELRGDEGARELLRIAGLVACDGLGRPDDVDTLEDLARLEAE
jgi:molybdenum cofactor cytidylyltransferase